MKHAHSINNPLHSIISKPGAFIWCAFCCWDTNIFPNAGLELAAPAPDCSWSPLSVGLCPVFLPLSAGLLACAFCVLAPMAKLCSVFHTLGQAVFCVAGAAHRLRWGLGGGSRAHTELFFHCPEGLKPLIHMQVMATASQPGNEAFKLLLV